MRQFIIYPPEILKQIYFHSLEEYPFECCGSVIETTSVSQQMVLPCKNIQNELHKSDPENNPRDARTAFTISPKDILKINRMVNEKNYKLKAIYHSHPENKAYFSKRDYFFAVINNEPTYPGTDYIIISIVKKRVKEAICFSWDNISKEFLGEEMPITY